MNTLDRVNEILADRDMTLYTLCQKAGVTRATFTNAKTRGNQLRIDTIEQVCAALDMPLYEFFMTDEDWNGIAEYAMRRAQGEQNY